MGAIRSGLGSRVAVLVVALIGALALAELGLRAAGVSLRVAPERVEFGWPDPVLLEEAYVSDPDLLWVLGSYEEQRSRLESDGGFDVAFLGDSCTEFGEYHWRFLGKLEHSGASPLRAETFGHGGWSSHQGRQLLERDLLALGPRVVFVYFGWNDHWIGFGLEDKDLAAPAESGPGSLRLVHLVKRARLGWRLSRQQNRPLRVSLDDFRANLQAMVDGAVGVGAIPVLITAPDAHRPGHEPVQLAERFLPDLQTLIPLHDRYVQAVRDVAAASPAVLCDAARHFDGMTEEERVALFTEDGIHLRADGDEVLADVLLGCVRGSRELSRALGLPTP